MEKCGECWKVHEGFHPSLGYSSDPSYINSSEKSNGAALPNMNDRYGAFYSPRNTSRSRQEVEAAGQVLLHRFLQERCSDEGLSEEDLAEVENPSPDELYAQGATSSLTARTSENYTPNHYLEIGRSLNEIANRFSASQERAQIREQANRVNLNDFDREQFFNLLNGIFRNGIDRYRIVALFFFCSDVLFRCLKQELLRIGRKLFSWAVEFIVEKVCSWVYEHGGWERVLSDFYKSFPTSAIVALGALIVSCSLLLIYSYW